MCLRESVLSSFFLSFSFSFSFTAIMLSRLSLISRRAYTIIPRTPVQEQSAFAAKEESTENSIHALYNKEYEEHISGGPDQTYRTLSDSEHHAAASADTFSPTFNTVFDE